MTASIFYSDGHRDAENGLPASPNAREYMAGYEDACEALQAAKFN